jgi:formate C-acetyltransferase
MPGADFNSAPGREGNVRDIIQQTYRPYNGNESFLAPAMERTQSIWNRLRELFKQERAKGVLEVSQVPSSIAAHAPAYIDRENEIIIGLQTEAPLRRAVMP